MTGKRALLPTPLLSTTLFLVWRRVGRFAVQLTPAKSCWVSLPGPFAAQLFDSQVALPLVLRLSLTHPSGAHRLLYCLPPSDIWLLKLRWVVDALACTLASTCHDCATAQCAAQCTKCAPSQSFPGRCRRCIPRGALRGMGRRHARRRRHPARPLGPGSVPGPTGGGGRGRRGGRRPAAGRRGCRGAGQLQRLGGAAAECGAARGANPQPGMPFLRASPPLAWSAALLIE